MLASMFVKGRRLLFQDFLKIAGSGYISRASKCYARAELTSPCAYLARTRSIACCVYKIAKIFRHAERLLRN